jgi:hypothetical protein
MTKPTEQDHEFIYLQPACCADEGIGRLWCEDPDPEDCEDGAKWTKYVRADLCEALQARVAELEAALQQQVAVADNANKLNSDLCSRAFNLKQERDGLAAKLKLVIDCGDSCCDEYCKDEWELAVNASADKAIAKLKADAVREACDKVVGNYSMCHEDNRGNVYLNITALRDYAKQIEREGGV